MPHENHSQPQISVSHCRPPQMLRHAAIPQLDQKVNKHPTFLLQQNVLRNFFNHSFISFLCISFSQVSFRLFKPYQDAHKSAPVFFSNIHHIKRERECSFPAFLGVMKCKRIVICYVSSIISSELSGTSWSDRFASF